MYNGQRTGNYSSAKDDYMQSLVGHPDYQPVEIYPFDEQTLRDSFTLQPGIIDNVSCLLPKYSPLLIAFQWEEIVAGPQEVKPKKVASHDKIRIKLDSVCRNARSGGITNLSISKRLRTEHRRIAIQLLHYLRIMSEKRRSGRRYAQLVLQRCS